MSSNVGDIEVSEAMALIGHFVSRAMESSSVGLDEGILFLLLLAATGGLSDLKTEEQFLMLASRAYRQAVRKLEASGMLQS